MSKDEFNKRKARAPRKAYQGKTRRSDPKDTYKSPRAIGSPTQPTQNLQKEVVKTEPRTVPREAAARTDYDEEDLKFNFKSGKEPVKTAEQPLTRMSNPHGRLPDEFHNKQFEKFHPDLI